MTETDRTLTFNDLELIIQALEDCNSEEDDDQSDRLIKLLSSFQDKGEPFSLAFDPNDE